MSEHSDESGHATRSTLNATAAKFCQKVSMPSEKEDIVDPPKNLRTFLPFWSRGYSCSASVFKSNERVEVSDKSSGFDFPVSTAPKAFSERAPIPTSSSSQADSGAHNYHGDSCSELFVKANERVGASDKASALFFLPLHLQKPTMNQHRYISSSQADRKALLTSSDNDLDFTFPVPLALADSEPLPNPQFKK